MVVIPPCLSVLAKVEPGLTDTVGIADNSLLFRLYGVYTFFSTKRYESGASVVKFAAQVVVVVERSAEVEIGVEVVEQVVVIGVIDGGESLVDGHALILHEVEGEIGNDAVDEVFLLLGFGFAHGVVVLQGDDFYFPQQLDGSLSGKEVMAVILWEGNFAKGKIIRAPKFLRVSRSCMNHNLFLIF